jgi:hypothetical protein
MTAMSMTGECG